MPAKKHNSQKNNIYAWKEHHESLNDADKINVRAAAMAACEWSQATFYVKMKSPNSLKFWEKQAIAAVYKKTVNYLFPEKPATANLQKSKSLLQA